MRPLTVFHLDGERGLRGGERQVLLLASGLQAKGHRNVIVCRAGGPLGLEAARLGLERLSLPFLTEYDPLSALGLRRAALAAERPLVHAHTGHTAALAALACAGTQVPRIAHRRVAFAPRRGLDFSLKYLGAERIIVLSGFIRSQMIEAGAPAEKIRVIPCSFPPPSPEDPERARAFRAALAEKLGLDAGAPWIGTLTALTPEKGIETLLEAYAILRRTLPQACLLIAGEGPLLRSLQARARRLGLLQGLRFLGQRPDPEDLLRAFDIYVQPSLCEGLGSAVIQAMSCGVPVAASSAGGLAELVLDRETGLSAPPGQAEPLARALAELIGSNELRAALAENALRRLDAFRPERMVGSTEQVYAEACREAPVGV